MLNGINSLLTGSLLKALDEMGHSDSVVVVDAHFPAFRLANRLVSLPGTTAPEVLAALRTVLPLDDTPAVDLMESADTTMLPVQQELIVAAGVQIDEVRFIDRFAFYASIVDSYLIVQTGETRTYGCVIVRKGLVGH